MSVLVLVVNRGALVAKNQRSILVTLSAICLTRFNRYSDVRNGWSDSNDGESAGPPITFTLLSPLAATHTGDQRQDGYFEQRRH